MNFTNNELYKVRHNKTILHALTYNIRLQARVTAAAMAEVEKKTEEQRKKPEADASKAARKDRDEA